MENATGAARKKDKPAEAPIPEAMDVETSPETSPSTTIATPNKEPSQSTQETNREDISKDLAKINDMCDELINVSDNKNKDSVIIDESSSESNNKKEIEEPKKAMEQEKPKETVVDELPLPKPTKSEKKSPVKKTFNKGKTVDLSGTIDKVSIEPPKKESTPKRSSVERKNSLPDESFMKQGERRKSRILETAEKFQSMNNQNNEKYKKFVIPGVSVGSFKKEFERKASISSSTIGPMERKQRNSETSASASRQNSQEDDIVVNKESLAKEDSVKESDSKSSVGSFSLEDARRSMENSIKLLSKAKNESSKELDPPKADTGMGTTTIPVAAAAAAPVPQLEEGMSERERKLKNAREIISNVIPRLGGGASGVRRPPMPFGANGRTPSGNLATGFSKPVRLGNSSELSSTTSTPSTVPEHPPSFSSSNKGEISFQLKLYVSLFFSQIFQSKLYYC